MRRCRSRLPCYICTSYLPSGLLQLSTVPLPQPSAPRESGSQVKARSVLDHPRTCRGEAQAPTQAQVDVCKASTDTVVSHKLSRNAGSPSRRTNGSLPDPGCWRACVRLLSSDSFGTVPAYLGATSPTFHQTSLNRDSLECW